MTGTRTFTACSMVSPDMETMLFNWSGDVDKTNFSCLTWTSLSHDGKRRTHSYNKTSLLSITWWMWRSTLYIRWVWCSAGAISSAPLHSTPTQILFATMKKTMLQQCYVKYKICFFPKKSRCFESSNGQTLTRHWCSSLSPSAIVVDVNQSSVCQS